MDIEALLEEESIKAQERSSKKSGRTNTSSPGSDGHRPAREEIFTIDTVGDHMIADYERERRTRDRERHSDRRRSRSPRRDRDRDRHYQPRDRHYQPRDRDEHERDRDRDRHYRDDRDRSDRRDRDYRDHRGGGYRDRERDREPRRRRSEDRDGESKDEADTRTVFVQQLAARVVEDDLRAHFGSRVGKVINASIVRDRISQRSKGVGYVQFETEALAEAALEETGHQLKRIPIIVSRSEANKNRLAAKSEGHANGNTNGVPFHRLYVGNIHFDITEEDLRSVFEGFGAIHSLTLQKDENGKSKGYGFVQFTEPDTAKNALEKMNGFEIAGRNLRVGLGNDKGVEQSTNQLLQRFAQQQQQQQHQGSAFSGAGGRGPQAGSNGYYDRSGGRNQDAKNGGASALDDSDVQGVNFNNIDRNSLMQKLARTDEASKEVNNKTTTAAVPPKKAPVITKQQPSRCINIGGMMDPAKDNPPEYVKELDEEVRGECNSKYGRVLHLSIDVNTGEVFIKFNSVEAGQKALQGLNGRFFDGSRLTAKPIVDHVYNSMFPNASKL